MNNKIQTDDLDTNEYVKKSVTKLLWQFEQPDSIEFVGKALTFKKGIELPSDKYSFLNKCIMYAHGTEDCRGYKSWSNVGRKVKKGGNFHILAPKMITKVKEDRNGKKKRYQIPIGFFPVVVWPYEKTEGEAIDYKCDKELPEFMCENVAKDLGVKIKQGFENPKWLGKYNAEENEIVMASDDQLTFFREITNAVHNKFKVKHTGKNLKGDDEGEKIIAEFSAVVLMNISGLKCNQKTAYDYIERFSKKKKMKTIRGVSIFLGKIEKILSYIIDKNNELIDAGK